MLAHFDVGLAPDITLSELPIFGTALKAFDSLFIPRSLDTAAKQKALELLKERQERIEKTG